jgi:hypothetical protein
LTNEANSPLPKKTPLTGRILGFVTGNGRGKLVCPGFNDPSSNPLFSGNSPTPTVAEMESKAKKWITMKKMTKILRKKTKEFFILRD